MRARVKNIVMPKDANWQVQDDKKNVLGFSYYQHQHYELCLITNANGQVRIADHVEHFKDFLVVLIPPNLPRGYQAQSNSGPIRITKVIINNELTLKLQSLSYELLSLRNLFSDNAAGVVFKLFSCTQIVKLFENIKTNGTAKGLLSLLTVLAQLGDSEYKKLISKNCLHNNQSQSCQLQPAINYLRHHFVEPINADRLADMVHMSTNHFHRKFKQKTDLTVMQLINDLRLEKACNLLVNSRLPIALISEQCGFNSSAYFNRRFLAKMGCQPRHFRSKNQITLVS